LEAGKFSIKPTNIPIPKPQKGQLLLRMIKAPVHPADMYFMRDIYGDKKPLPCVPGLEGVGEVVEGPSESIGKLAAVY